jgi:hypothetical protein
LSRINRWYLDDMQRGDVVEDLDIKREDFAKTTDVIPVSDPHIFSETQRMAQTQAVLQLATQFPQSFDVNAVLNRMLKQLKVQNIDELMPVTAKPTEMDAADENAAMSLGRRAFAYPRQDQLAHIQAHLNFALDPALGSNPLIAQTYIPQVLEHIKQHMMLWYTNQMKQYVTAGTDLELDDYAKSKIASKIDEAIAIASDHVKQDTQQVFQQVLPTLQQLGQMMQQFAPPPAPMDSEAQAVLQASMAETQRRTARDQADIQQKGQDLQAKIAMNAENNLTKERMKTADLTVEEVRLKKEQTDTAITLNQSAQRGLQGE